MLGYLSMSSESQSHQASLSGFPFSTKYGPHKTRRRRLNSCLTVHKQKSDSQTTQRVEFLKKLRSEFDQPVFLLAVKAMESWPCSRWKPCWQRCVGGKLWTNYAVSVFLSCYHVRWHMCELAFLICTCTCSPITAAPFLQWLMLNTRGRC